jgi:hypothetical protein
VAQVYALASILIEQSANYFVIEPLTNRTMLQRQKLEKEEGKLYNDTGVSSEMKALNATFGQLHGIASLAKLSHRSWFPRAVDWQCRDEGIDETRELHSCTTGNYVKNTFCHYISYVW